MRYHHLSLRTKMTLAVSGLVLLLMLITAGGTLSYFERLHEASVRTNQANVVRLLSMNVDNSLRYAKDALQRNADNLPEQALQSEAGALTFLKSRTGLYNFFTGHLFMFAVDGRLIAEYPSLPHDQHRLSSFAGQPAFKKALATAKPQVSSPTACCAADDGLQAFMFVPVVRNGRIRAVLAGSVDLKRPNRLSEHMQEPSGVNGVIRLISDDYQVVAHVNPELIGRQSVTEVSEAIDQALKQGSVALTNISRYQLPTFTYLHRLETADWVLAASIPVDEVYAPVRTVRTWFIL
ncbi:MAG: hypothetical protein AB7T17_08600, partial [Geobacter sp.]